MLNSEFYIPLVFDVVALFLFAITGALSAAKRGYDWIGTMAIAFATGCGGGLIRDILLNVRPTILEHEPYLWAVVIAVLISTYLCQILTRVRVVFFVADALGLALYAVIGTQKSLSQGLGIGAAILIGTLNAIGGGLIRDILTREEASILKPGQWYAMIALGASLCFALMNQFTSFAPSASGALVVVAAFSARILARRYNLQTRALRPIGFEDSNW